MSGRHSMKGCVCEWCERQRALARERGHRRWRDQREQVRAANKRWRDANRDLCAQRKADYYQRLKADPVRYAASLLASAESKRRQRQEQARGRPPKERLSKAELRDRKRRRDADYRRREAESIRSRERERLSDQTARAERNKRARERSRERYASDVAFRERVNERSREWLRRQRDKRVARAMESAGDLAARWEEIRKHG